MCCRRKQQGGWGLLACEFWAVYKVEAIEGEFVSCNQTLRYCWESPDNSTNLISTSF